MSEVTLLDALETLASLPHAAPPRQIAKIARDLIGSTRTAFFGSSEDGIAREGVDEGGNLVLRPPGSAADLEPFYLSHDADGLSALYDLEPGPWVSLRLDAGTPRGAIVADGLSGTPTAEDIRTWRAFAATLALRLGMTNELVAVTTRAETDALTGASMRAVALSAVDRNLRNATPTTLIFIDLDNFKIINDVQGHKAGDLVLINAAATLREACRQDDVVARFGGDEFVVVSSLEPQILAPRLVAKLALAKIDASVGYASTLDGHHSREALFEAADASMYATKRANKAARAAAGTAGTTATTSR